MTTRTQDEHQRWLDQVIEDAIEPELPILDTHHHLWEREGNRYLLDELFADVEGHNLRQSVFVECTSAYRTQGPPELAPVGETEWVDAQADEGARSAGAGEFLPATGIVGTADLRLGEDVGKILDAHMAASPRRLRGIRHRVAWAEPGAMPNVPNPEQPQGMLLDPQFRRGFAELEKRGLSFDAWLYHPQLPELADIARVFPNTRIILNHLGGPIGVGPYAGRRSEVFAQWRAGMAEVAQSPNVVLKVGGFQMPFNGHGFHERERPPTSSELAAETRDWYLAAIEQFGPERCMFESNFPADRPSCSYRVLWNAFKRLTASFSAKERAAMFHDNALRVYRLARH